MEEIDVDLRNGATGLSLIQSLIDAGGQKELLLEIHKELDLKSHFLISPAQLILEDNKTLTIQNMRTKLYRAPSLNKETKQEAWRVLRWLAKEQLILQGREPALHQALEITIKPPQAAQIILETVGFCLLWQDLSSPTLKTDQVGADGKESSRLLKLRGFNVLDQGQTSLLAAMIISAIFKKPEK